MMKNTLIALTAFGLSVVIDVAVAVLVLTPLHAPLFVSAALGGVSYLSMYILVWRVALTR